MKKIIWIVGGVAAVLVLIYGAGSYYFSNVLMTRETQTLAESEANMAEVGVPAIALPAPEAATIEAGDMTLRGFFYDNEQEGECAVLMLHGYTGTRYGTLQYAPLFWQRGCDLLAYDARGHGESDDAFHTYGYFEKEDGVAAYQWLLERTGLDPADVGLVGVSYGAATVLQMLPLTPEVAFVLSDSPYQDLKTIVTHQAAAQFGPWVAYFVPGAFFISELRAGFEAGEVSPRNAVQRAGAPVLIIHSRTDEFTSYTHSEAIYANANPATTELVITDWGSPHARDILTDYPAYEQLVASFLAAYAPDFGLSDGR